MPLFGRLFGRRREPPRRQISEAVLAFINAPSWDESKRIVEARRDELLTDAADEAFATVLEQYRGDVAATATLEEHRALLTRCRREGIDAAFANQLRESQSGVAPAAISEAVLAFIKAPSWGESKRVMEARRDELLTDVADEILAALLEHYAGDAEATRTLEEHRALLARCRRGGIDAAFAERLGPVDEPPRERLVDAVLAFINAQTWRESKHVVEARRDELLLEAADRIFAALLEQHTGNAVATRDLEEHRRLLARCRREGIDAAFADRLQESRGGAVPDAISSDLRALLAELQHLTRSSHMPRRVEVCRAALRLIDRDANPTRWAALENELANSLAQDPRGERAENLEEAIRCYRRALEVYTREAFPEQWAANQNNLANAYSDRIWGERAENLERAIDHYERVLEVYTREAFPADWAMTQHNLANAYHDRIGGERPENLEEAIRCYRRALEVHAPTAFPLNCRDTAYALGLLLYGMGRFSEARRALATAHEAVESLRGEAQREAARRALADENADLYARLVYCCLVERDETAAFEYAAAGKGRAFVDLLATARVDLSAAGADDPALAEDLRRARELRQQIDALLAVLTGASGPSATDSSRSSGAGPQARTPLPPEVLRGQLGTLQAQEAAHWDAMADRYPALTATQQAPALSAERARALAGDLAATLVEYYRHAEGWCAFVVTPDAVRYIPLPDVGDNLLQRMVNWMARLELGEGRNRLGEKRLVEWHAALIAPLQEHLSRERPVVLAPFGVLHLLPLAAARESATGRYAGEEYTLAFAPSLSALRTALEQTRRGGRHDDRPVPHRLLSVAYPGAPGSSLYLPNVLPEAQAIAGYFAEVTPLHRDGATPDAVVTHAPGQEVVHLGCHGWFDPRQPQQSGLMLAGGWLTVQRIITELRLGEARLATLGACLSGRAALRRGEEHVGLMQAVMTAGARAVVASLWPVDDAATRALFEAFYAGLAAGRSPAAAMQAAAGLVRARPGWGRPYYWAAFQVSGLAHGEWGGEPVTGPATCRRASRHCIEPPLEEVRKWTRKGSSAGPRSCWSRWPRIPRRCWRRWTSRSAPPWSRRWGRCPSRPPPSRVMPTS